MSKQITLYCQETPGLKLGPGTTSSFNDEPAGNVIVFSDGFATFDPETFPEWERWITATGTPHIRVVDGAKGEATDAGSAIPCPIPGCDGAFSKEIALNSHLRAHARRGETV